MDLLFDLDNLKDEDINSLYPIHIQKLSNTHWTPLEIAIKSARFLSQGGRKSLLDLGSGSGKFCLVAAMMCKEVEIVGVEQRDNLVRLSRKICSSLQLNNLKFLHANLLDVDFKEYESFYFFNSFEEMINSKDKLDKKQELDVIAHAAYIQLLRQKFDHTPIGSRIVTYCGECAEIPDSYNLVKTENRGKLRFWEKFS